MKYTRFEDLPVWKAGMELCEKVFLLMEDGSFRGKGDLGDQLRRAAMSITNNVAEGFERGSTQELITFLYYARGSAGEARSMLRFCERMRWYGEPEKPNLKFEISNLILLAENVSRQLRGWADALQNSEIKGQKYLTDAARDAVSRKTRVQAFLEKLERIRRGEARPGDDGDSSRGEPPVDDRPWPDGRDGGA
jgi:four helix bundle protein